MEVKPARSRTRLLKEEATALAIAFTEDDMEITLYYPSTRLAMRGHARCRLAVEERLRDLPALAPSPRIDIHESHRMDGANAEIALTNGSGVLFCSDGSERN